MRVKKVQLFLALTLALLFGFQEAAAQAGRGKARLNGLVLDEAGNPVASAKVVIELLSSEPATRETKSDKNGEWAFIALGSGNWRVTVTAEGYVANTTTINVSQIEKNPRVVLKLKRITPVQGSAIQDEVSLGLIDQAAKLFNEKNYDQALTALEEFLAKNPNAYQAYILIGDCYREKGEMDKAIESYNKAIDLAKSDEKMGKSITAKALAAIGDCYLRKGEFEAAQGFFKQSIDTSPDNETLAYNVGEICFSNQKLDEAIQYFTIATKIKPAWAPPYYKLGLVNLNKADYEKAKENFKKFLELEPKSDLAEQAKNILEYLEKIKK